MDIICHANNAAGVNLRSIDLNLLTVFDAIYRARNMTRAAQQIGLSQPAISLALGRLRDMLDDPLFVRAGGAMQPTPRAQQIAGPIESVLDTVASTLLPRSGFDSRSSDRQFNLALGDYGSCLILPRLSQVLEETGASIRLRVPNMPMSQIEESLTLGKLDLALTFFPVTPREFRSQLVCTDTLSVIARHGHPLMRDGLTVEQYCALLHVIAAWPQNKGLRPGEQALFERSLRRREFVMVDSFMQMPAIVAVTDAIGTMATRLAKHFADAYGLKVWPGPLGPLPAKVFLVWHKSQDADEAHAWIRTRIINLFGRI